MRATFDVNSFVTVLQFVMFERSSSATTVTAFLGVTSATDIVGVLMEATKETVVSSNETFTSLHLQSVCTGPAYNQRI